MNDLFNEDQINVVYSMYDRMIVGGVMPVKSALKLEPTDDLKAQNFLDRRELGIINVGAAGKVTVDGVVFELGNKEALYIGKGAKDVVFENGNEGQTLFYFNSAPAHHTFLQRKSLKTKLKL